MPLAATSPVALRRRHMLWGHWWPQLMRCCLVAWYVCLAALLVPWCNDKLNDWRACVPQFPPHVGVDLARVTIDQVRVRK